MAASHPSGPVVGVVGHGHLVPRDFGELPVTGTPPAYLDAVLRAGGRPVILPPASAPGLLDLIDALVLTGGGDIDPARYGGAADDAEGVDRVRDSEEIALARAAVAAGIPILGICRGLQVLVVAFGGTLVGGLDHRLPGRGHEVDTAPGSLIHALLGDRVHTNALHRQAVLDPGPRWRPTAHAGDGTVEAIEPRDSSCPVLAVQWHPELGAHPELGDATGPALFDWLIGAARRHAATPSLPPTQGSEPTWQLSHRSA